MHGKKLIRYKGNFDAFEKQRMEVMKNQQKEKASQDKEISNLQNFVDKNRARASTAKMAQSRLKRLERMVLVPEIANDPQFNWTIPSPDYISGPLVQCIDVSFGWTPEKILYTGVNFNIEMETKVALIGSNGIGKSTLLKLMLGEIEPISGMVKKNQKVRVSRFTQHHVDQLDLKKTPLQFFQDMYPEAKHQDIRKHLGSMGITGNLALQPIFSLSGGQKSRVAFANITYTRPQLILLDEPSNHLDLDTIECLIRALNNFDGAVVIVSHDEHLITTVCNEIWVCDKQSVARWPGDFEDYKQALLSKYKSGITL